MEPIVLTSKWNKELINTATTMPARDEGTIALSFLGQHIIIPTTTAPIVITSYSIHYTKLYDNALQKILSYIEMGFSIQWQSVLIGAVVVGMMICWPKKLNAIVPSSLAGIVVAVLISSLFHFDVSTIGSIPKTLLPQVRLNLFAVNISELPSLISPAISIAALGIV